jgi:hypothetical protein
VIRFILRLFPRWWRVRYGSEAADLVSSPAEAIDLALTGLRTRFNVGLGTVTTVFACGTAGLSLWLSGYATGQLAGGPLETFNHWWSAFAAVGVLLGVSLAFVTVSRLTRSRNSQESASL